MASVPDKKVDQAALACLDALANDTAKQPKAVRFRRLYDAIERALNNGITRQDVIRELSASGLELTPATFNKYLVGERKRNGRPIGRAPRGVVKSGSTSSPIPLQAPSPEPEYGSHDPRTIDAIINKSVDLEQLAKLAKKGKA